MVGYKPTVSVFINGVEIVAIDLETLVTPNYDSVAVAALLGSEGHIAFEVHDNDSRLKDNRWGRTAACRWRNIRIKEL